MEAILIPTPDTIPVAWGWFQLLLLLTFPLHLLAMNAMLGGLAVAIVQQFSGSELGQRLAHKIALALPLVIAFVVNLGVAPLLFLQVLYGQFAYTSSILIGIFWIMVIPLLIVGYYGAYLYDFKFRSLGRTGVWVAVAVLALVLVIAYFFSNNMLLMTVPEHFGAYFDNRDGSMLISGDARFLPRYVHMVTGALAVGGLAVALLGRFRRDRDPELAEHAHRVGLKTFAWLTSLNVLVGIWYLLSQERQTMMLFMGRDLLATGCFIAALLLAAHVIVAGFRKKLVSTLAGLVALVYLMSFMRAWLRTDYLRDYFTLDQLEVVPQYSPMIFFFVVLVLGLACLCWMLRLTAAALRHEKR